MGTSASLPSFPKLKKIVLLRLHRALIERDEVLPVLLLEKFHQVDTDLTEEVSMEEFTDIIQDLQLCSEVELETKVPEFLQAFESSVNPGQINYVDVIGFLRPPGKVSCELGKPLESVANYKVYQANRKSTREQFLVKQIEFPPDTAIDLEQINALQIQIDHLKMYKHPNLLHYVGSNYRAQPQHFQIVQQYAETCTLQTTLKAFGPMNEMVIRRYLGQLVQAIKFLHQNGITHANLHGESVYIDHCGLVKVGEYGVGHLLSSLCPPDAASLNDATIYEEYPPPETLDGENTRASYGQKSDVWCIGLLVMEMLSGSSTASMFSAASKGKHPAIPKEASADIRHFLQACFQAECRHRPSITKLQDLDFLQEKPQDDTNRVLSDVCSSLESTMKRLQQAIPSSPPRLSRRERREREREEASHGKAPKSKKASFSNTRSRPKFPGNQ